MTTGVADVRLLDARELDASPFAAEICEALFAAVLVDDRIDTELVLPSAIHLDCDTETLLACFRLCRQLWQQGGDWLELRALAAQLLRDRDLDAVDRVRFKHMRAKLKHFRFAHALYSADHRYPRMIDGLAIAMGKAQDAYKSGRHWPVVGRALLLRLLLWEPLAKRVRAETDTLVLTTPADFRALLLADYAKLGELVAAPAVTGHGFHQARKVVGRQLSFWDTLRTLEPSEDSFRVSRWLSAINSLMGSFHDDLVERRAADPGSYHTEFAMPDEIRQRIVQLLHVAGAKPGSGN